MSLILEALRKSEAERRRGATPDVTMELPPAPMARNRPMPAWLVPVLVVAALAILATLWWRQRATAATDALAPPQMEAVSPSATPAPVVVVRTPTKANAPATVATAPPPAAPPVANVDPRPAAAPPRALPPPPSPVTATTPDVADIDNTAMPPVKLSMHMWDETPGKRFVILNGQRMAEGDRNGEITVVAIERDGVVVERNGQRARVPLP